ncbi:MAG: ABC transporter permease [Cyanobacteria bacterium NC_groundwater_1444_Ag_S-0.65um_54_12]|nr:ABC transporter permease [Cyanobacteria bacterium NC_groundwater_1444_Ag_S-0.65um_54_12]
MAKLAALGRWCLLLLQTLIAVVSPPYFPRQIWRSMRIVGIETVAPVVTVMAFMGMIAALQGLVVLRLFGAERLLAGMITQAIIRDLAPAMTALMLAAQVGTAIAGEIGAMRTSEELAALRVLATNPVRYLVVPWFLALALLAPLLTGMGATAALGGSFVVAVSLHGAAMGPFVAELVAQITGATLWEASSKALVFGAVISLIACHHGLEARTDAQGVGRAANATIVQGVIVIAAVNAMMAVVLLKAGA